MSSRSESRNDQCIGNLHESAISVYRKPEPRRNHPNSCHPPNAQAAGELCVDKTQSAQICNLCVEKNPRPRRARTNSGRAQLLIGKTIIGRCSNNFLLANRPIIVFPIRKTPVQILAKNGIRNPPKKTGRVTKLTAADFCAERDPARPRLPQHYPAGDS